MWWRVPLEHSSYTSQHEAGTQPLTVGRAPMKLLQLRSLISHYGQEYRVLKSYQNMQDGAVTSDWYWLVKIKSIAGNAINQNKNWKKHDQCSWCGDPRPRGLTSTDLINEAAECRHGGSASAPQQGWDNGKYFDLQPRWGTFLVKICLPGYGNNIPFLWCSQFFLCTSTTGIRQHNLSVFLDPCLFIT